MSKTVKLILMSLATGLALTIAGLLIPQTINTFSSNYCATTSQTGHGYPLWYVTSDQPPEMNCNISSEISAGANGAVDAIAQHTPGHQTIFNVIQNNSFNIAHFFQDFIILTLISLYPVSYIVNSNRLIRINGSSKFRVVWLITFLIILTAAVRLVLYLKAGGAI